MIYIIPDVDAGATGLLMLLRCVHEGGEERCCFLKNRRNIGISLSVVAVLCPHRHKLWRTAVMLLGRSVRLALPLVEMNSRKRDSP